MSKNGTLYVVATPIGNLEDITIRALRILKEVDVVLCEDTRVTVKLLNKYGIKTKLINFHKFNEKKIIKDIIEMLKAGKNIAIVSDAGTPLISDPGSTLVLEAKNMNININSIPGPSAVTTALSLCPFDYDDFLFVGFLPNERSKRFKLLSSLNARAKLAVLFVAPHDLKKYLEEIYNFYPDIDVFYARELTKKFEEYFSGKITELINKIEANKVKGEIVLILHFASTSKENNVKVTNEEILNHLKEFIEKGYSLKEASKAVGKQFNFPSKIAYSMYLKTKNQGL